MDGVVHRKSGGEGVKEQGVVMDLYVMLLGEGAGGDEEKRHGQGRWRRGGWRSQGVFLRKLDCRE